jgi:hypothetical protein
MKHLVSIWRLTLRKILTALMGASSLLLGACPEYGTIDRYFISGTVKGNDNPVQGFEVSIQTKKYNSYNYRTYSTLTDENGTFKLIVSKDPPPYTVFFQDVDGSLNGEFNSKTVQWALGDGPLNIVLEPK